MAAEVRLESGALIQRVDGIAQQLPELAENVRHQLTKEGIKQNIPDKLARTITERSVHCRKLLATAKYQQRRDS